MSIIPLDDVPEAVVEALLDAAFGPDRHSRTAYRIREGMTAIGALSLAWVEEGELLGSLQCWPVRLSTEKNEGCDMIMVGPVAVHPHRQQQGIGKALMRRTMELHDAFHADAQRPMMMIGDASYYGEWGFSADHTAGWHLPGPFERDRLLLRWNEPSALPSDGAIGPRA